LGWARLESELESLLRGWKCVLICGVGNPFRRDDGVGAKVVQELVGRLPQGWVCLDCGTAPERCLDAAEEIGATHVLLVDAGEMGLQPGAVRLLDEGACYATELSTHRLPLGLLVQLLRTRGRRAAILAVQAVDLGWGEGTTEYVARAASRLADVLARVAGRR